MSNCFNCKKPRGGGLFSRAKKCMKCNQKFCAACFFEEGQNLETILSKPKGHCALCLFGNDALSHRPEPKFININTPETSIKGIIKLPTSEEVISK
jgi:hypothetical protein